MGKFAPKMYYQSIFQINYKLLKEKNIKVLIFDLDNTIITVDEELPNDKVVQLINKLKKDFIVLIASNNIKLRVRKIGKYLKIKSFYSVLKPSMRLKKLLKKKYDMPFNEVAVIGDQIVTDILVGNRCGMLTILVDPIKEKDLFITYFNRWLEKRIMKRIKIKRGVYYEENKIL